MTARISMRFKATAEQWWAEIVDPKSLQFVASPILYFRPIIKSDPDREWVPGKTYAD